MGNYKLIDLAEDVLKEEQEPLTALQIWVRAKEKGYIEKGGFKGKDAFNTIAKKISMDIEKNLNSVFVKIPTKPHKFFLAPKE